MSIHKPVLLKESIESLNLKKRDIVVDATLGGGGHSLEILKIIGNEGKLVAIDVDKKSIENFKLKIEKQKQNQEGEIFPVQGNFADIKNILEELKIGKVDAILADLGYSSDQLEDENIGMSFLKDSPLDMRLNRSGEISAEKIVNDYSEEGIKKILEDFGEERYAKQIARAIVEKREEKRITTTKDLVLVIESAVPESYKHRKINAATKTFQAIRIETNKEFENLDKFIDSAIDLIKPRGRLSIISFHSLEDRIVKSKFRENARGCICPPELKLERLQKEYISAVSEGKLDVSRLEKALKSGFFESFDCPCGRVPKIRVITKKPIVPSDVEIGDNPRSRSAKLRVAEMIG